MGVGKQQAAVRAYRGQITSPGRPSVAWREDRVRFWAAIALGLSTEDASAKSNISWPVGFRWFRHAGGVRPNLPPSVSGRYLSFAEREDIARSEVPCLRVHRLVARKGVTKPQIARRRVENVLPGSMASGRRRTTGKSSRIARV